jgi:hypothetical protein
MKNLVKYFSKNKKKIETLEKIRESGNYLRAITSRTTYVGKIEEITSKEVVLRPYTSWENLPQDRGSFLNRVKIEEEIGIPLKIDEITPEKTTEKYMFQFAAMMNYFAIKNAPNKKFATGTLEKGFPFPSEEQIDFLEGRSGNEIPGIKNLYSENKIGFKTKPNR